jgi:hypothetical protein
MEDQGFGTAGAVGGAASAPACVAGPDAPEGATCATAPPAVQPRIAEINHALIIALRPAVALRVEQSLAAAPSSKIPTKRHLRHHHRPETRSARHRAEHPTDFAARAAPAAEARTPEAAVVVAVQAVAGLPLPPRTKPLPSAARLVRTATSAQLVAGEPEFALRSAQS